VTTTDDLVEISCPAREKLTLFRWPWVTESSSGWAQRPFNCHCPACNQYIDHEARWHAVLGTIRLHAAPSPRQAYGVKRFADDVAKWCACVGTSTMQSYNPYRAEPFDLAYVDCAKARFTATHALSSGATTSMQACSTTGCSSSGATGGSACGSACATAAASPASCGGGRTPAAVVVPILVAVEDAEAAVEPAELEAEAEPVVMARIQIARFRWSGNKKFNYTRGLKAIRHALAGCSHVQCLHSIEWYRVTLKPRPFCFYVLPLSQLVLVDSLGLFNNSKHGSP